MSYPRLWDSETSIVDENDWNAVVNNFPVKNSSYIVRKNGSYYEAIDGNTGKLEYGGENNAGSVDGTDAATVIQSTINALTSGRTWKEKVSVKGDIDIDGLLNLPSYTTLEIQGRLRWTGSSPGWMIANDTDRPVKHSEVSGFLDANNVANVVPLTLHSPQQCNFPFLRIENVNQTVGINLLADSSGGTPNDNAVHNHFGKLIFNNVYRCIEFAGSSTKVVTDNYFEFIYGYTISSRGIVFQQWVDNNYFGHVQFFLGGNNAIGVVYNDVSPYDTTRGVYANNFYSLIVDNLGAYTGVEAIHFNKCGKVLIHNFYHSGTFATVLQDNYADSYEVYDVTDMIKYEKGLGYKNSGTATITNGNTQVQFAHGLAGTPTLVTLGATHAEVADAIWSADATNITITVPTNVTANRNISWYAEYKP